MSVYTMENIEENLFHSLRMALNFDFFSAAKFELYRRKDDRYFRFIRYSGDNYNEVVDYLQNGDSRIRVLPEWKMVSGGLYNIDGHLRCRQIPDKHILKCIAANNYLVRDNVFSNILLNYELAKYLVDHNNGYVFKNAVFTNDVEEEDREFRCGEDFETIAEDSFMRIYKVWYIVERPFQMGVSTLPDHIIESYVDAPDFYKEYEVFMKNGLKGIAAYKRRICLLPEYQEIHLDNYRAYVQNAQSKWAVYMLKTKKFVTDFIYDEIISDIENGMIWGIVGDEKMPIFDFQPNNRLQTIFEENGLCGVCEDGNIVVIPAEYDSISKISWDLYVVLKDQKSGLFDHHGRCVIPCAYDYIDVSNTRSFYIRVQDDDRWGLFTRTGKQMAVCQHSEDEIDGMIEEAFISYVHYCYQHHRFIDAYVLRRGENHLILRLPEYDKTAIVRFDMLSEDLVKQIEARYNAANKLMHCIAFRFSKSGNLIGDYNLGQKWKEERIKSGQEQKAAIVQ